MGEEFSTSGLMITARNWLEVHYEHYIITAVCA
jgi:hypothetical protein